MKKVIHGWCEKDVKPEQLIYQNFLIGVIGIHANKLTKLSWYPGTWPPKKVKVTVEIFE